MGTASPFSTTSVAPAASATSSGSSRRPKPEALRFVRGDVRDCGPRAAGRRRPGRASRVPFRGPDGGHDFGHGAARRSGHQPPRHAQRARSGATEQGAGPAGAVLHVDEQGVRLAARTAGDVEAATRYHFADPEIDARGISEREPLDFHSPYGCSKGAADQYVHDYARIYKLRTVVFRMSCIYGPRQFGNEDQGWVAHFMLAVASGAAADDLRQRQAGARSVVRRRSGAGIQAGVAAHRADCRQRLQHGRRASERLSIWAELRPRLEQLAGRPVQVQTDEWRPGDQPVYVSDTRKAGADFGWQPLGQRRRGPASAVGLGADGGRPAARNDP